LCSNSSNFYILLWLLPTWGSSVPWADWQGLIKEAWSLRRATGDIWMWEFLCISWSVLISARSDGDAPVSGIAQASSAMSMEWVYVAASCLLGISHVCTINSDGKIKTITARWCCFGNPSDVALWSSFQYSFLPFLPFN
jgi:hypothetical protein